MSEEYAPEKVADSDVYDEIGVFRQTLQRHSQPDNWPNQDQYFGALSSALLTATEEGGILRAYTEEMFDWHHDRFEELDPHIAPNLLRQAWHKQAVVRRGAVYPEKGKFDQVAPWLELIDEVVNDEDAIDEYLYDTNVRIVQATWPWRAMGQKILMISYPERYGSLPSLLAPGCGLNLELKYLENQPISSKFNIDVVDANDEPDIEATVQMKRKFKQPTPIGPSLGVDIWDFHADEQTERWQTIGSIKPREMIERPTAVREFHLLIRSNPMNVHFTAEDFAEPDLYENFPPYWTRRRKKPGPGKKMRQARFPVRTFDAAFSSTTTYQLDPLRRDQFIHNMQRGVKDDGLVANQDYASVGSSGQLDFASDIYASDWLYRMNVLDKKNIDAGWQEMLIWDRARPTRLQIGAGRLMVRGKLRSIRQQLGLEA